jgi:hypothetical protein
MKTFRLFVAFALICFALSPKVQAVVPPPPGGYPNFTTAAGDHALQALTLGLGNTAIGTFSLFSVTTGSFNTALGAGSLDLNTADSNTATGAAALLLNTTGTENTAIGTAALEFNDIGDHNTANGAFALFGNTEGSGNTAVGSSALTANTTGNSNTAIGISAFVDNVSGFENVGIGGAALFTNVDGHDNIAIGQAALSNNTSGNNNIGVGLFGGSSVTTSNNVICIGTQGQNMSDSCFIGQIFGATAPGGSTVVIDANNRLGTMTSSKRFKEDIEPMDKASETLFALKPVVFRYKKEIDPAGTQQLGLVAEEVEKVNPELVVHDKAGKPYSVRYDQVNAMLLNEFLKEHRKVEGLKNDFQAAVAQQQKEIAALLATVKEQASQIQKVSAQLATASPSRGGLEASKFATGRIRRGGPAPQVVNNNQ